MKTLKTLTAAVLMVISFSAFAADKKTNSEKAKMSYAVNSYVDALVYGRINGLAELFESDVKYSIVAQGKVTNFGKSDILKTLRFSKNIEQNCTAETQTLEQDNMQSLVKVTLHYPTFSKVSYVNMANTGKGWKITNITASFSGN